MTFHTSDTNANLRHLLGLHQRGDLLNAERGYREILAVDPVNVDALHLLAMLIHERGDSQAALRFISRAVSIKSDSSMLLNSLSVVLMGIGDLDRAREVARTATELDQSNAEARKNASTIDRLLKTAEDPAAQRDQQDDNKLIDELLVQIEREPHRGQLLNQLYELGERTGRIDSVVTGCVSVLKGLPESVPAHVTLGLLFSGRIPTEKLRNFHTSERLDLRKLAFHHLRTAATLKPCAETFDAWGLALLNANMQHAAITKFDLAIANSDQFAKSYENRGRANLELGRIEKAIHDYDRALSIDPALGLAQLDLAKIETSPEIQQERIDLLRAIGSSLGRSGRQKSMLNYALGHRLERTGDNSKAFDCFCAANALKEVPPKAKLESWMDKVSELKTVYDSTFFRREPTGYKDSTPIFVVSMPRSGSTLVETILARHSAVVAGGEMFDISDIAHSLKKRLVAKNEYPQCGTELDEEQATEIGKEYSEHAFLWASEAAEAEHLPNSVSVVDKMPTNFWHLGLIASILPNAKVVNVQRNPMDVCLSCFKQNLTWPFCDLKAIVPYFESYRVLMKHWASVLPLDIYTVSYEDLVTNPEQETKTLIEACGLKWEPSCLDHESTSNSVQTPSKWQVRQPIYKTSVASWKRYEHELASLRSDLQSRGFEIDMPGRD